MLMHVITCISAEINAYDVPSCGIFWNKPKIKPIFLMELGIKT